MGRSQRKRDRKTAEAEANAKAALAAQVAAEERKKMLTNYRVFLQTL